MQKSQLRTLVSKIIERIEWRLARSPEVQGEPGSALQLLLAQRRRLATVAIAVVAVLLAFRVILGTNGTVVYGAKRDQYRALQVEVEGLEKENWEFAERNQSLKSDPEAIEREAREQLRYAKPGEVILMLPEATASPSRDAAAQKR
jgi:cell division protein FtsB